MADLEQERVTALWREAAAALDQPQVRDEWPAFTENFYRDTTTRQWVYRWSDARIVVAGEDCAGCGRLREQLDATREALKQIEFYPVDVNVQAAEDLYDVKEIARAALGVVGEQE
jgi:hypothetical protein